MVGKLPKLACILVGALLAACTSPAKHTRPAPVAPAAAPLVTAAGVPARPVAANPADPAVNQDLLKSGYRVKYRRGEALYCRPEATTGTRLTSTLCRTEAQIKEDERRTQEALRPAAGCPAGLTCK